MITETSNPTNVAAEMGDGGASSTPTTPVTPAVVPTQPIKPSVPSTPKGIFGDTPEQDSPKEKATPVVVTKPASVAPTTPVAPVAPVLRIAPEDIAALRGAQQEPAAPTAFTPEEQAQFDRSFNIVRVTKERFKAVMGFEPENDVQRLAFEAYGHDIAKQAVSLALYQANELFKQKETALRETLAPIMSSHQSQRAVEITSYFETTHPDLKDHTALIQEITAHEKAKGTKFKSVEEASTFVANRARALLGKTPVSGGVQPTSETVQPVQRQTMPTTMVGGRPGNPSSSQVPVSGPRAVFGTSNDT